MNNEFSHIEVGTGIRRWPIEPKADSAGTTLGLVVTPMGMCWSEASKNSVEGTRDRVVGTPEEIPVVLDGPPKAPSAEVVKEESWNALKKSRAAKDISSTVWYGWCGVEATFNARGTKDTARWLVTGPLAS